MDGLDHQTSSQVAKSIRFSLYLHIYIGILTGIDKTFNVTDVPTSLSQFPKRYKTLSIDNDLDAFVDLF